MVLSNKKLKQQLRATLAESLAKSESQVNQPNLNDSETHQSFKSLLNSAAPKPVLSKREKRRLNPPVSLQGTSEHENGVEEGGSDGGLKNNKKRKRDKDGAEVKDVEKEEHEVKDLSGKKISKKKNKKKKTKKKKVVKKEEEESVQIANGVSEEQTVTEAVQTNISKEDSSISTKLYVGGIPYYSTVDDIRSFFEGCGSITEIDCLTFPETGKFNGIAMISFRTEAAAKRALALDGSDMGGLSLKVQPYKATRDKKVSDFAPAMLDGYNRIYVGNLSWDITEDELKKFFSDCSISSIRLGKDKETGEFRGFAHVDFSDSLSLTMALKLDQKLLYGRPVRVRCAVPPKSANPTSKSDSIAAGVTGDMAVDDVARKGKRQTCYDCGEKGHLSSSCPNKKTAEVVHTGYKAEDVAFNKQEADGSLNQVSCYECGETGHISKYCPKKKGSDVARLYYRADDMTFNKEGADGKLNWKSCYECGEMGHVSSYCPYKQAADVANSGNKTFESVAVNDYEGFENTVNSVTDGKLRRRTCYECGERGHLSSACPKKQADDMAHTGYKADYMEVERTNEVKTVAAVGMDIGGDNAVNAVSEGKLRRRTCYECGERGHLSSLCPKKQAADMAHSGYKAGDMAVEKTYEFNSVATADMDVGGDSAVTAVSEGKLRRRTCYECGERGHLSSLCPKKQAADVASSRKEANYMEVEKVAEVKSVAADVGCNVSDGKVRRRNCYECGQKGHLSSMCPYKKVADMANLGST